MTAAADARLLSDWNAGKFPTREAHLIAVVGTIDTLPELTAFTDAIKAIGGMTDDIRIAALRRQQRIGASLGTASRP